MKRLSTTQPIHVMHVLDKLSVSGSGIHGVSKALEWWIAGFAKDYSDAFKFSVCSLRAPESAGALFEQQGAQVFFLDKGKFDPTTLTSLLQLIQAQQPDILHLHGYGACNFGRLASAIAGIPNIVHEHVVITQQPLYQTLADTLLAPLSTRAIAVSNQVYDFMVKGRKENPKKLETLIIGIPTENFQPPAPEQVLAARQQLGIRPTEQVVCTVGRLDTQKGQIYLLKAAKIVLKTQPNTRFLIVGDGPDRDRLEAIAQQAGIDRQVTFTGLRQDVPALLAFADVVALPSLYEGGPLTLLEAMNLNKPVIGTPVGFMAELIQVPETGFVVPCQSIEPLAEKLIYLLQNPAIAQQMGQKGGDICRQRYDISQSVTRLSEIYTELTATNKGNQSQNIASNGTTTPSPIGTPNCPPTAAPNHDLAQLLSSGATLVIAPHMDDAVLGCGGTLAQLSNTAHLHVVYATDGAKSPIPELPGHHTADLSLPDIRTAEAKDALQQLNVPPENIHFLNFPDGELKHHRQAYEQAILSIVQRFQPRFVLIPFRHDWHADHLAVNQFTTRIIQAHHTEAEIFEYFIYYRSQLLPAKDVRHYIRPASLLHSDIRPQAAVKRSAIAAFQSQVTPFYDWQQRPLISAALIDEVCSTPEVFLRTRTLAKAQSPFVSGGPLIGLITRLEPALKKVKTRLLFLAERLLKKQNQTQNQAQNQTQTRKQPAKRRICLLTESYYPIIGGGETQSRVTAEDLVANGFEVMVVARQSNPTLKAFETIGNIKIYRVPPTGDGHLKRWLMTITVLPLLIKHRRDFDILFVSSYRVIGMAGMVVSKLFGKPCILKADNNGEMSGVFFAGGLKKWNLDLSSKRVRAVIALRNKLFKKADGFISISSEITHELILADIPQEKIHNIPNSVDVTQFYPVGESDKASLRQQLLLPAQDKIVVYTGRLMSTKGLPLLVQVWNKVHQNYPQAMLIIVGGGSKDIHDCEDYLHEYVATHQLEHCVRFTGNVSNVDEYLKASDIFVFPTEDEAFGISMIEAMACGLAAIATPIGGLQDIVTPGENGLTAAVGSVEQWQQAITHLLNDPQKVKQLGQAALQTVQERYTREAVAKNFTALFNNV